MLVGHSHQNEVELVLHKHTSSCYMDAELAVIIFIYGLTPPPVDDPALFAVRTDSAKGK